MRYSNHMEFPLAQRELTQAGRDRRTYILRTVLAGGAVVFLLLSWMFRTFAIMAASPGSSNLTGGAEIMGQSLAMTAQAIQLLAAFLVAPIVSAGLICTERQEGTLGLLLMADLSGRDVFLAKFLRAFLFTELLLISMLPFASFAALLGGVSVPDVAARLVALTFYAAAVCAVGLLFSALARRPAMAFFLTMLFTIAWLYGTSLADVHLLPALGLDGFRLSVLALFEDFLQTDDIQHILVPQAIIATVVGLMAAALTICLLPGLVSPSAARRHAPIATRRRFWRRLVFSDPAERIVSSGSTGFISGLRPWPLRVLVFIIIALLSAIPACGAGLIVKALMFYDILSSLHAARRDGSLDELVLTPLPDRALAHAIFRASLRSALFYGSAGAAFSLVWIVTTAAYSSGGSIALGTPFPLPMSGFASSGPLDTTLLLLSTILRVLIPIASAVSGAAIASYIGVQRGGAARHTATALAISLFLSAILTVAFYFIFVFTSIFFRNASVSWLSQSTMLLLTDLAALVLNVVVYAGVSIAFFSLLADGVRRHLGAQLEIYIAVARPAKPNDRISSVT